MRHNETISSLFLSKYFDVRSGVVHGYGVQQVVYHLSKALLELGVGCCIVSEKTDIGKRHEVFNGIPIYRVSKPYAIYSFLKRITSSNDLKFSIVHSHYLTDSFLHVLYRKAQPHTQPFILQVHGRLNRIRNHLSRSRFILKSVDAVMVPSVQEAEILTKFCDIAKSTIKVVPLGVDIETFRPCKSDILKSKFDLKEHVVLYVGHCTPRKGLRFLLEAAPKVLRAFPRTTFLFAGVKPENMEQESYKQELISIITKYRIHRNVKFLDFVPHYLLPTFFSTANVYVLPSLYEGFGMTSLEAMACGTPIIATKTGFTSDYKDQITSNLGFIVEKRQPNQIADAITHLLSDPDLAQKLGQNGRRFVEKNFSWRKIAQGVKEIYEEILEMH